MSNVTINRWCDFCLNLWPFSSHQVIGVWGHLMVLFLIPLLREQNAGTTFPPHHWHQCSQQDHLIHINHRWYQPKQPISFIRMTMNWLQTCLTLALMMGCFTLANGQLQADLLEGFKLCPGKQYGNILSVEVDGPGCHHHNGQTQWPCLLYPDRRSRAMVFRVSFTHLQPVSPTRVRSSIHAYAITSSRLLHVPFLGEVNKNACPSIGCPMKPREIQVIKKRFTVPSAAGLAHPNMGVEFKLTTDKGKDTIICFIVPVMNQYDLWEFVIWKLYFVHIYWADLELHASKASQIFSIPYSIFF